MRKKLFWIAAALVLIAIPAVIGIVALRDDDGADSARRAGALVPVGSATEYQLQLTQAQPGTNEIKDAIEVESFSWGVENSTTIGSATGGASAGKIKFNQLDIKKKVDNASPLLFKQSASGVHYKKAVLALRQTGEKEPYMTYTMDTVFITKLDHSGASPEVATEEVTFVFGKLVIQSVGKNADGKIVPVQAGWNQVTNKSDDQP